MFDAVVITCEHGGNHVPAKYKTLFAEHEELLASHRGYDPGALELARQFSKEGRWPLHFSTTTRLLVELNRSRRHSALFSAITKQLGMEEKREILRAHYEPYRIAVEAELADLMAQRGKVLHLSVHSFTPILNGEVRRADVGLLYDPRSSLERTFCDVWRAGLSAQRPDLVVRRNYPYRGAADGFTTFLRRRFAASQYAGVELEVNQRFPLAGGAVWKELRAALFRSLHTSSTALS